VAAAAKAIVRQDRTRHVSMAEEFVANCARHPCRWLLDQPSRRKPALLTTLDAHEAIPPAWRGDSCASR